jgi:hypothetical protein
MTPLACKLPKDNVVTLPKSNREGPLGNGDFAMRQLAFFLVTLAAVLTSIMPRTAAQDVGVNGAAQPGRSFTENLAFSKDGSALREVRRVRADTDRFWCVRAITYDATTGSIRHVLSLGPDSTFYSATYDGRTAIISVDADREDTREHFLLVDMETGHKEDIPANWFNSEDQIPYAKISADGRFVSTYTESGPEGSPLVVTLYDWRTKKLVGKQSAGTPAGGIYRGGVTEDGKIEFSNNRSGGQIVDPKTGRLIVDVGPRSHRSLDGAWMVEFPNPMFTEPPVEVIIKDGRSGAVVGKLEVQITDGDADKWAWGSGAFCGTSGRFIAATNDTLQAFNIPSGKKIADLPLTTWQDMDAMKTDPAVTVACSLNGKRVAIRSGVRLTLHDLK